MGFGSRGMASHSSPAYREAITRIASALAERYGSHPAVVMWHVHNEYGVPVGEDYSDQSAQRLPRVAAGRATASLDALNRAWGTAFWGQHYGEWDHIGAPAAAPSVVNPAQRLDFARFTDHQLRACFIAERDAIRAHATQPITTNFMANQSWTTDLWAWADVVDIVSDDHYLWAEDPEGEIGLAIAADLSRSVGGGKPWILMEHSTSAVNWQPRNVAKRPGEMARNSLSHLGRGADAILFFQWRASRSGAEKFHSAMLPHAGTRLARLARGRGARRHARPARRAARAPASSPRWRSCGTSSPSGRRTSSGARPRTSPTPSASGRSTSDCWRDGITVDFALPGQDLSAYRLVIAPAQYLLQRQRMPRT